MTARRPAYHRATLTPHIGPDTARRRTAPAWPANCAGSESFRASRSRLGPAKALLQPIPDQNHGTHRFTPGRVCGVFRPGGSQANRDRVAAARVLPDGTRWNAAPGTLSLRRTPVRAMSRQPRPAPPKSFISNTLAAFSGTRPGLAQSWNRPGCSGRRARVSGGYDTARIGAPVRAERCRKQAIPGTVRPLLPADPTPAFPRKISYVRSTFAENPRFTVAAQIVLCFHVHVAFAPRTDRQKGTDIETEWCNGPQSELRSGR